MNIVAISGSLQKASCNTGILRALVGLNHKDLHIEIVDIHNIPLFDEDIEREGVPVAVKAIADKVRAADGLIFAVPENNYSVSAPLKNIYDWLSRGGNKSAVYEKPVAFVSAGGQGGPNAQKHMKEIIGYCKLKLLEQTIQIKRYEPGNFGADGSLTSAKIIEGELAPFLNAFAEWVKNNKK